jgi:hypothetical protein
MVNPQVVGVGLVGCFYTHVLVNDTPSPIAILPIQLFVACVWSPGKEGIGVATEGDKVAGKEK